MVITPEVYAEVVVSGSGLPGAQPTKEASWIEVLPLKAPVSLASAQARFALVIGELSTLVLAREIGADLVLLDDLTARKLAQREELRVQGTRGILEACYERSYLSDLRLTYVQLLLAGVYLDRAFLNKRLTSLHLQPL